MSKTKISTRLIRRQAKVCNIQFPIQIPLEGAKKEHRLALMNYKKAKPTAREKCDKFIEHLAETYEADGNDKAANQVRALNKQEYRRDAQREVKQALRPTNNTQILHVEVVDNSTESRVRFVYNKEEMEKEVMKDHVAKYTEFCDTPSLLKPLRSIIGPFGLTMTCELILQGKSKLPPVIHPDIVEFFEHLEINEDIKCEPPTSAYNPVEDYKAY